MKKELGSGKGSFIASVKVVLAMERKERRKRNKETTTLRRKTNKSSSGILQRKLSKDS